MTVIPAVVTAAVGSIVSLSTSVLALNDPSGQVTGWAGLAGGGIAITGMAYVLRRFASGELVMLPVAELLAKAAKREEVLADMVTESHRREDDYRTLLLREKGEH